MKNIEILCDSHHGVYIPQIMIKRLADHGWLKNTPHDELDSILIDLSDPQNDWYWDSWGRVLNDAELIDPQTGDKWLLHQDGDLFAYCPDLMTENELNDFFGEY